MSKETLYESERTRSRVDIAATFRSLADQLETDGTMTFTTDDRSVTVELPERSVFEVEIERERESDEPDEMSIEFEIDWSECDATGVVESESTAAEGATSAVDTETEVEAVESLGRFEVFRDRAGEWRWRLVHRNGNIIATSGEGYTSRQNALKGMRSVMRNAPGAEVVSK